MLQTPFEVHLAKGVKNTSKARWCCWAMLCMHVRACVRASRAGGTGVCDVIGIDWVGVFWCAQQALEAMNGQPFVMERKVDGER